MDIVKQVAEAIEQIPGNPSSAEVARVAIEEYQNAMWAPLFRTDDRFLHAPALRQMRASATTSQIMQIIGEYLCRHGEVDGALEVSRELYARLYETGAEVVTDVDRSNAGLLRRDGNGLTMEELRIMEAKRIQAMLAPMPVIFPGVPRE